MAFNLSEEDDAAMCCYLESVLEIYSGGNISLKAARADIAHAIVAATVDDERAFKRYIRLSPEARANI